jgi:hypothetical protein
VPSLLAAKGNTNTDANLQENTVILTVSTVSNLYVGLRIAVFVSLTILCWHSFFRVESMRRVEH